MVRLSVNVNKVAVVRNARGGTKPSVIEAVDVCIAAGSKGITVHPRSDERHITPADVRQISQRLSPLRNEVEFNIEGDPQPDWLELVHEVKPHQATLVPVRPGEITSEAGWPKDTPADKMMEIIGGLKSAGIRVSLFVDADESAFRWAHQMGGDRVELYTGPFAELYQENRAEGEKLFQQYVKCAELAHKLGMGINAGHDLDLNNLPLFAKLPYLDEVSIGHALIGRAIFEGLGKVVGEYLKILA